MSDLILRFVGVLVVVLGDLVVEASFVEAETIVEFVLAFVDIVDGTGVFVSVVASSFCSSSISYSLSSSSTSSLVSLLLLSSSFFSKISLLLSPASTGCFACGVVIFSFSLNANCVKNENDKMKHMNET